MEEDLLPENIRRRASVSPGGEHAWRVDDVEEAVLAGRNIGLACLGGQVQFQLPDATCECYWLNYGPEGRRAGELWQDYVFRSTEETISAFRRICEKTDFGKEAYRWDVIRRKMDHERCDPTDHLWFILSFEEESTS